MANVSILRGGSGKWQLSKEGLKLCSGHVPKQAPFEEVVIRQIARFASAPDAWDQSWANLGGGYVFEIEIPDKVLENLERYANERKEEKRKKHEYFTSCICPKCGGKIVSNDCGGYQCENSKSYALKYCGYYVREDDPPIAPQ